MKKIAVLLILSILTSIMLPNITSQDISSDSVVLISKSESNTSLNHLTIINQNNRENKSHESDILSFLNILELEEDDLIELIATAIVLLSTNNIEFNSKIKKPSKSQNFSTPSKVLLHQVLRL